jgi:hypothetical protein
VAVVVDVLSIVGQRRAAAVEFSTGGLRYAAARCRAGHDGLLELARELGNARPVSA